MQQQIDSMAQHADVLLVLIYLLGAALIATIVFIFKSVVGKQKIMSDALHTHDEQITKLEEKVIQVENDVEKALSKSEEIEKNNAKKFDGLSRDIQSLGSRVTQALTEEIAKIRLDLANIQMNNEKYFMTKVEFEKIQSKLERAIEKLDEKIND